MRGKCELCTEAADALRENLMELEKQAEKLPKKLHVVPEMYMMVWYDLVHGFLGGLRWFNHEAYRDIIDTVGFHLRFKVY